MRGSLINTVRGSAPSRSISAQNPHVCVHPASSGRTAAAMAGAAPLLALVLVMTAAASGARGCIQLYGTRNEVVSKFEVSRRGAGLARRSCLGRGCGLIGGTLGSSTPSAFRC